MNAIWTGNLFRDFMAIIPQDAECHAELFESYGGMNLFNPMKYTAMIRIVFVVIFSANLVWH